MALRLTTAKSAPETRRPAADRLADVAAAALRARDLKRYASIFAETADIEDFQRRYQARKAVIERGLEIAPQVQAADYGPLFHAIAEATVAILDEEAREPVLLNYSGVAFYELGQLAAAELLFKAAQRLDPELEHVDKNLAEIARRRRDTTSFVPRMPKNAEMALPALAARAEKIASRARPAEGLKLSLCMIVKDEEEMLPRCLDSVHDAVDEIVIVDTGSTDRTVEIAESFGAKVLHKEWTGDFAEARNASFDAATGDWILYLDADEVLVKEDAERLRAVTGRVWRESFFIVETNFTGDAGDGTATTHSTLRVFRNRPEYRFEGRIHEQIAHTLPAFNAERLEYSTIRIEHYGYLGAVRSSKEKSRRNIELLERQRAEGSGQPAFLAFNLGSEYAAAGEAAAALKCFEESWEILRKDLDSIYRFGYVPSLLSRLVKAYRVTGDLAAADATAVQGLEIYPGFTDLVYEQAQCAKQRGDVARAVELFERCLEWGDAPSKYSATNGCGTYLALMALAEVQAAAARHDEADRLFTQCLDRYPEFLGVVLPASVNMLRSGVEPAGVAARVGELVAAMTPSVRFMVGTALYEAGHAAEAETEFRAVLEAQPSSEPGMIALGEALLSQCRWDEAVAVSKQVTSEAGAAPATRTRMFAAIVSGDDAEAAAALEDARQAAVPEHEVAVFNAWRESGAGAESLPALPVDSVPLLAVVLEALLRVREVDAFARLLPVMDAAPLDKREKRELLGTIYFRRGFLDSAAEEWMGACEDGGPDSRALLGLAQVAYARDMKDDAVVFASEAHSLDPENAGAARLIAALTS
ncbi:MAG: glycosyltransferase [Thermoleophilaceae bacterium]